MRFRLSPASAGTVVIFGLAPLIAGCSSNSSQEQLSSNLGPRPSNGMSHNETRRYPDGSTAGTPYDGNGTYGRPYAQAPRRYVDPGQPTPREYAAYDSGHTYAQPRNIQTASIDPKHRSYDPDARWQQPQNFTTGSTGGSHMPHVVQVREGDTLYNLSRRYNVPIGDLVAANRLTSERIVVGQRLVIPTRYR